MAIKENEFTITVEEENKTTLTTKEGVNYIFTYLESDDETVMHSVFHEETMFFNGRIDSKTAAQILKAYLIGTYLGYRYGVIETKRKQSTT